MIQGPDFSPTIAHSLHYGFEWLALLSGVQFYRWQKKRAGQGALLAPGNFAIVLACVTGAAIGNKLVFWLEYAHLFASHATEPMNWLRGQSLVGGLLGGLLGIEITKKILGIKHSTGDLFVFPILFGIIIGRVGCFLAGLQDGTYGVASNLPWAVDFGDGVPRHPTQLYEIVFIGFLWLVLAHFRQKLASSSGLLFKCMLSAYLLWRVLVDAIKPVPFAWWGGLSGIQSLCIFALLLYLPLLAKQFLEQKNQEG